MEFLRIFIDANVLISALVFDGNELKILFECLEKGHRLVISDHVEEEIFRTMLEKFPEHSKLFHEFIELADFEIVPKKDYINKLDDYDIVRDKHDRHVLACAVVAKCGYIITGDKDLLDLKSIENVNILNSRDALNIL